jgi:hypothetical protein
MRQALYGAFWESLVLPRYYKWDVVKARQASHGLTKTRQKGHWKIMLSLGGERENTHTWDRWTCANGKKWSRGTKEVLVIGLHIVGKWVWIFKSWSLEIPNELYRTGDFTSFYFYTTHIFLFFSYIYFFFLSSFLFFFFFFLIKIFICSPWTLKLHCTYLLPHA